MYLVARPSSYAKMNEKWRQQVPSSGYGGGAGASRSSSAPRQRTRVVRSGDGSGFASDSSGEHGRRERGRPSHTTRATPPRGRAARTAGAARPALSSQSPSRPQNRPATNTQGHRSSSLGGRFDPTAYAKEKVRRLSVVRSRDRPGWGSGPNANTPYDHTSPYGSPARGGGDSRRGSYDSGVGASPRYNRGSGSRTRSSRDGGYSSADSGTGGAATSRRKVRRRPVTATTTTSSSSSPRSKTKSKNTYASASASAANAKSSRSRTAAAAGTSTDTGTGTGTSTGTGTGTGTGTSTGTSTGTANKYKVMSPSPASSAAAAAAGAGAGGAVLRSPNRNSVSGGLLPAFPDPPSTDLFSPATKSAAATLHTLKAGAGAGVSAVDDNGPSAGTGTAATATTGDTTATASSEITEIDKRILALQSFLDNARDKFAPADK